MKFKLAFIPVFLMLFFACTDTAEYRVDSEFEPFIYLFEKEAGLRGINLNLRNEGLIVEFADLKDDQAGLCHYEKPIRIEIDRDYWQLISKATDVQALKENLIFHELGHGILDRRHNNSILENGDWKSIMCGGTKVNNRSWNINYNGRRRAYYLDELFHENTVTPEYMTNNLTADTAVFQIIKNLDYSSSNKYDTGFDLKSTADYTSSVENNQLKIVSHKNYPQALLLSITNTTLNNAADFMFEMDINPQTSDNDQQFGLIFTNRSEQSDTIEYFKINRSQNMFPGNSLYFGYYSQLPKSSINLSGYNSLKVYKINNILYYFINNEYAYQTESIAFGTERYYGFVIPASSTMYIDNFKIGIKNSSGTIQKLRSVTTFTNKVIPLNENISNYNK